jgi:hypothetical protein
MIIDAFYAWFIIAGFLPFLAIVVTLAHFCLFRALRRRRARPGGRRSKLYPYCLALGMAFLQFVQFFYQQNVAYLLEAKRDEDADEDDNGDPETLAKQLNRQLRRIRRGEPVDRLVLRL